MNRRGLELGPNRNHFRRMSLVGVYRRAAIQKECHLNRPFTENLFPGHGKRLPDGSVG